MRVETGPVWSKAVGTKDELDALDDYLSCEEVIWRGTGANKRRVVEMHRMLERDGSFPTGFTPLLDRAGFAVDWLDPGGHRGLPGVILDATADLGWLRHYQKAAVLTAARRGRGLIKVPTGGGKTEIFVGLTRVLPVEWLFLVHRGDLVHQAAARYTRRTGEQAGVFEGGRWTRGTANVTVSTFQAVYAAMQRQTLDVWDLLEQIEAINVDEVHAQPADTFYQVSMAMEKARYRFGQSATPLDRDEVSSLRTIGCLGPIVYEIKRELLVAEGVLAESEIYMPPLIQEVDGRPSWPTVYSELIINSATRNAFIADLAVIANKPSLCFVDELQHGRNLQTYMEGRGLRVGFATGKHSVEHRARLLQQLVQDRHDVLLCTVVFQEGIDVPDLRSVLNGCGKKSAVACLQRIGRGMRVATGKDTFQVFDPFDGGQKWIAEHAQERYDVYRGAGHDVKTRLP